MKLRYWIRDNVIDIDYEGSIMPPPAAVAGTYKGPDGQAVKVAALSDEDRRTIIRWVDLGCPIDLDPLQSLGYGWHADDQRPTLTLTYPAPGRNPPLSRILIGMCDAYSGLDLETFRVVADFPLAGAAAGENLTGKFRGKSPGVWELTVSEPPTDLARGTLTVSIRDRQGNVSRIERKFSVAK